MLGGVETTYIWVPANLLDHILVEVTGVAQESGHVICMLQSIVDHILERELASLLELGAGTLALEMDVLYPAMMASSSMFGDVLLEDDDIRIRDVLCICR